MSNPFLVPYDQLKATDLLVDATYQGGRNGNASDDPFSRLLQVSNMGGFRYRGRLDALEMVVLTTSMSDPDWPDALDVETGTFTYYGDNKRPGTALHETARFGNEILRRLFEMASSGTAGRCSIPPIFIFSNAGSWRDVVFRGLAVPGTAESRLNEDLIAIWKIRDGMRFQNYRSRFTILNASCISRKWIQAIVSGDNSHEDAPPAWRNWMSSGAYRPLTAVRSVEYRSKVEQLPLDEAGRNVIKILHKYFADRPHEFESCASDLARMMLPDITQIDVTRPSRDGGRDAIGQMRIGNGPSGVLVDFALEAKCYGSSNSVGVRELSRLISRLRHRQFGILVTTSYLDIQAYKELKDDGHPIVVISARDIVELLRVNGWANVNAVSEWLAKTYSLD